MFKKINTCLFILFSISSFLWAQTNKVSAPVDAQKAISEGIKLHDHEHFEEAILRYDSVNKNDDYYFTAQIEKANSLYELKKYDQCLIVCEPILKQKNMTDLVNLYVIYGNALDELNRDEEALEVFNEGIKKYPLNYLLPFNKGIVLKKQKNSQEALKCFEQAILNNPYHYSSHLQLGIIASEEGKITEAMFSFMTCLLLKPKAKKSLEVLGFMDQLVSKKYEEKDSKITFSAQGDDFSEIEALLRAQVALNPKYKATSALIYPVIKQAHLLLSQLEKHTGTSGFYERNYLPFFKGIYASNNFEGFSYFIMLSTDNPKVIPILKKNESKIKKFQLWGESNFVPNFCKREIERGGHKINTFYVYDNKNNLYLIGNMVDNKIDGMTEMYNENGYMAAFGNASMGKMEGLWKYYDENGNLRSEIKYMDDKLNGLTTSYYQDGVVESVRNYKMDSLDGKSIFYFPNGNMSYSIDYANNKKNGFFGRYYPNGKRRFECRYTNNDMEGIYIEYYRNGDTQTVIQMSKGIKNGMATYYYPNAIIQSREVYKDGKLNGPYNSYYEDGKKKAEGKYLDDEIVGTYMEYYDDGTLASEYKYDEEGNLNGTIKNYTTEGWLESEITYQRGKMSYLKYFDKSGNIYYEVKVKDNVEIELHRSDKSIYAKGKFVTNERDGKWVFYNRFESIVSTYIYNHGVLNGPSQSFYANGILKQQSSYKNGEEEGLYQNWYDNGQLMKEGWMEAGDAVGQWYEYAIDGTLSLSYYKEEGALKGQYETYDVLGKLKDIYMYKDEFEDFYARYDTSGNETYRYVYGKGTSEKTVFIPGSKTESVYQLKDRLCEGAAYVIHENGVKAFEGQYSDDQKNGTFVWRNTRDSISNIEHFEDGKLEGITKIYGLNGSLRKTYQYTHGDLNGIYTNYYLNGAKMYEMNYKDDMEQGNQKFFGINGELFLVLMYDKGDLIAWVRNSKQGTLTDTLRVTGAKQTIEANYKNGTLAFKDELEFGMENGTYMVYQNDGKVVYQSKVKNDKLEGERTISYPNGKLYSREFFIHGDLEGECNYYWENGNLMVTSNYKRDELHGTTKLYDINGKLKETRMYYDDELISIKKN